MKEKINGQDVKNFAKKEKIVLIRKVDFEHPMVNKITVGNFIQQFYCSDIDKEKLKECTFRSHAFSHNPIKGYGDDVPKCELWMRLYYGEEFICELRDHRGGLSFCWKDESKRDGISNNEKLDDKREIEDKIKEISGALRVL